MKCGFGILGLFRLAVVSADCIIAPGEFPMTDLRSPGPIFKSGTCSQMPLLSEDGNFWVLPEGTKCTRVMCLLKTGGSSAKYRK